MRRRQDLRRLRTERLPLLAIRHFARDPESDETRDRTLESPATHAPRTKAASASVNGGRAIPRSVMIAVISSAGVTSKAG